MEIEEFFMYFIKKKQGMGKIHSFWEDSRVVGRPIAEQIPHIYRFTQSKNIALSWV